MSKTLKGLVAIAAFMTLAGAGIANAQSSSPRPDPTAQQPPSSQNPSTSRETSITGELMRVNPDSKMFTVKNATGEIQFKYSDSTVVTGAQKTVAGLATMSGEQVTVSYRVENGANIATHIEVKEKK
jgi:beta-xylosidase